MQLRTLNPYLMFNGKCEEAFKFYAQVLGGTIDAMMTHEGMPMESQVPADWRKKIIHARLSVGDKILMGSDAPPSHHEPMKGFSVTLGIDKPAEADRVFNAFAKDGTVRMQIQETFWAIRWHGDRQVRYTLDDQLR
jgi:PhnB protein